MVLLALPKSRIASDSFSYSYFSWLMRRYLVGASLQYENNGRAAPITIVALTKAPLSCMQTLPTAALIAVLLYAELCRHYSYVA
jgi:hypothetical protein